MIRAGKCIAKTATEVMVRFNSPPQRYIANQTLDHSHNYIRIRFNPDELIALGAVVRKEGEKDDLQPVELMVSRESPDEVPPYARLLQSAMAGDPSLFGRADVVESMAHCRASARRRRPAQLLRPGKLGTVRGRRASAPGTSWHNP